MTTASYHLSQKVSSLRYWYSPILQSQLGISISLTENKTKSDLNEIELYFFLTLSESYWDRCSRGGRVALGSPGAQISSFYSTILSYGSHSQGVKMSSGATAIMSKLQTRRRKNRACPLSWKSFPELPGHTFTHISLARTSHMATWPDLPCQQCGASQGRSTEATTLLSFFPLLPSLPYRIPSFSSVSHMYWIPVSGSVSRETNLRHQAIHSTSFALTQAHL